MAQKYKEATRDQWQGAAEAWHCVRFERESFGALHQMLAGLTEAARDEAWQEIEHELERYESGGSFESPCEVIVGTGVK